MRTRLGWLVVVALAATGIWPGDRVAAEAEVSRLRIGLRPDVTRSLALVPFGTHTVYARFDYSGASNHAIGVGVAAYGGVVVHRSSERYSGSGSATVAITGAGMLRQVAAELLEATRSARTNARNAATQQFGVLEYLSGVQAGVNRMQSALAILQRVESPVVSAAPLADLVAIAEEVSDLADRALQTTNEAQRRQLAERMADPLDRAVQSATALDQAAAGVTEAPLPRSGADWDYRVQVTINDSPSMDTQFRVDGGRIRLPYAARRARVGAP